MTDCDYTYHECEDLSFIIHFFADELLFDVDYKDDFLLLDLGPEYEVTV